MFGSATLEEELCSAAYLEKKDKGGKWGEIRMMRLTKAVVAAEWQKLWRGFDYCMNR